MRKELILSGDVSEGGVKYFAQRIAMQNKLTGFSKRGANSTIIVQVQGAENSIDKFKRKLLEKNQFFTVTNIDDQEIDVVESERMFSIK